MAFFDNFYSVEWFLGGVLISLIYATPTSFAVYVIGLLIKHITRKKLKVNWKEFLAICTFLICLYSIFLVAV